MNCSDAEQFFDAYLDGEMAGSLRLEFDAHRLRCPVCQQKLAMMEACEHILTSDAHGPRLSADFTDRVMNEISSRKTVAVVHTRRKRLIIAGAAVLQAAAVILFALLWAGGDQTSPVLDPGNDPLFTEKVGEAIAGGDRVRLMELVDYKQAEFLAARSTLEDDMNSLARYAKSLSIFDEIAPVTDTTSNPWGSLLNIIAPQTPEDSEPAPDAAGTYSL